MRQWYYVTNGVQNGPVDDAEFKRLFGVGVITPETMVWTGQMTEWAAAGMVGGLIPQAPPGLAAASSSPEFEASGDQVRPWLRYFARLVDIFLVAIVLVPVGELVYPPLIALPDQVFGMVTLLVYMFIEPIFLASWGTTPGKALLNIRLRKNDGSKLSYSEGLKRCFRVWLAQGLGIGIVALITQIMAYKRLMRHGTTSWDDDLGCTITHRINGPLRTCVILLVFAAFAGLIALGAAED